MSVRVVLPPSTWLHSLTVAHPESQVEVLDRLLLTDRPMLTEARLHGPGFGRLTEEIRRFPTVEQVEVLEGVASRGAVRVTHHAPEFMAHFRGLRILRRFPFWVANGQADCIIVGTAEKLRQLLKGLAAGVPEVRVEASRVSH